MVCNSNFYFSGLILLINNKLIPELTLDNNLHDEALHVLKSLPRRHSSFNDSASYLTASLYFNHKKTDSALKYYSRISPQSPHYNLSQFLQFFCYAYDHKLAKAESFLQSYQPEDSLLQALKMFELAGLALLRRDTVQYKTYLKDYRTEHYQMSNQWQNFENYHTHFSTVKRKSAFLAGALSALVPGLGKVYAGKRLQGLGVFLQLALVGVQVAESAVKAGLSSVRFGVYAAAFGLFYIGNIWGSAVEVKRTQKEKNDLLDKKILLDMHTPLRTVFG